MDKIFIHALKTEAIIGIFDWERQVKQTVVLDIEISADVAKAALSDSIHDTLNYKRIAKRVLAFVEESKFHLVETLAERVAGMTAGAAREWDAAEQHYERALRQAEEMPIRLEIPQVRHWYAVMLLDRGRPEDRPRARSMLAGARDDYRRLGMPLLEAMAETRLD